MSTSTQSSVRRPGLEERVRIWPAYLLAACCPGAGHVYRLQPLRGLCWAILCVAALVFLSPGTLLAAASLTEPLVLTALRLEAVAFADVAFPLAVLVLSVIDLYGQHLER